MQCIYIVACACYVAANKINNPRQPSFNYECYNMLKHVAKNDQDTKKKY